MSKIDDVITNVKELFAGPQDFIGLDMGSYAVKAIWIGEKGKEARIKGWAYSVLDLKHDATPEERKFVTAKAIKDIFDRYGISEKAVALSVSGSSVIVRFVTIAKQSKQDLAANILKEAEPFIPFDIREVSLGYQVLNDIDAEGQKKMELMLVAAKRQLIDEKLDITAIPNLNTLMIDVDAFALESIAARNGHKTDSSAALLLNIGHRVTNIVIVEKGLSRVVRDIAIAGFTFNKALAKSFKADIGAADELKKKWGLKLSAPKAEEPAPEQDAPNTIQLGEAAFAPATPAEPEMSEEEKMEEQVSNALKDSLKDLITEVRRSIDFYLSQNSKRSLSKIILSGGSANMRNLPEYLSKELKVSVEIMNPISFISEQPEEPMSPETRTSMSVAAGLSLRKMGDWK